MPPETLPLESRPLVAVENLTKHFPIMRGVFRHRVGAVRAVDGLDFAINPRETLGLVGESGCGKSTAGRVILRLDAPTAGRVIFRGEDITRLRGEALRRLRPHMQMIFQDPQDSLNPRMTVGSIVGEPLREHGVARGAALRDRVEALLDAVGLDPAFANRYPHEFSGGQRQRIGVARALALKPAFHRLRRADRSPRCLDPGAGGEPAEGAAGAPIAAAIFIHARKRAMRAEQHPPLALPLPPLSYPSVAGRSLRSLGYAPCSAARGRALRACDPAGRRGNAGCTHPQVGS